MLELTGTFLVSLLLGAISHMLGQLAAARKAKPPIEYDLVDITIALVTGLFSGFLFGIGAQYVSGDELVVIFAAGVGGFTGLAGVQRLTDAVLLTISDRVAKSRAQEET